MATSTLRQIPTQIVRNEHIPKKAQDKHNEKKKKHNGNSNVLNEQKQTKNFASRKYVLRSADIIKTNLHHQLICKLNAAEIRNF